MPPPLDNPTNYLLRRIEFPLCCRFWLFFTKCSEPSGTNIIVVTGLCCLSASHMLPCRGSHSGQWCQQYNTQSWGAVVSPVQYRGKPVTYFGKRDLFTTTIRYIHFNMNPLRQGVLLLALGSPLVVLGATSLQVFWKWHYIVKRNCSIPSC